MTSLTVPTQASLLRVGGYMCINGEPCKIKEILKCKTGKHGGCKCHFIALNIFTEKKHECLEMSTKCVDVPTVTTHDYQLLDIDENAVSYLDDDENVMNDLVMPNFCTSDIELCQNLKAKFDEGEELYISVISAMDITAIKGFRINK